MTTARDAITRICATLAGATETSPQDRAAGADQ